VRLWARVCGSVRAKVEANSEGSCRKGGDHRTIVVVVAYGRNGEASAELLWSVGDPRTVVVGLAVGRAGVSSAFGRRLWNGESSCRLVCVWGDERAGRPARFSNQASVAAQGALHFEGAATKVDREYADSDVSNFCFFPGPSAWVGRRIRARHCLIHSRTLAICSVVSATCESLKKQLARHFPFRCQRQHMFGTGPERTWSR
jgi:hypothetical protein